MDEVRTSLTRRGMIAGLGAAAAGVAGAALLPDRADAAVVPKRARPALRNTSVTAPPVTAVHAYRMAAADFFPAASITTYTRGSGTLTITSVGSSDVLATFRPNPGDLLLDLVLDVNPNGVAGTIGLSHQASDGTITALANGTIPATTGFTTITTPVNLGPLAEADPEAGFVVVLNVGSGAAIRGATVHAAAQGGSLILITPQRVLDTRIAAQGPKIASGQVRTFTVDTIVPRANAGVLLNVTLDQTVGSGFLTVFAPDDVDNVVAPPISNINWYTDGQIVANLAISDTVGEADINLKTGGPGSTHDIIDVIGYVA